MNPRPLELDLSEVPLYVTQPFSCWEELQQLKTTEHQVL